MSDHELLNAIEQYVEQGTKGTLQYVDTVEKEMRTTDTNKRLIELKEEKAYCIGILFTLGYLHCILEGPLPERFEFGYTTLHKKHFEDYKRDLNAREKVTKILDKENPSKIPEELLDEFITKMPAEKLKEILLKSLNIKKGDAGGKK